MFKNFYRTLYFFDDNAGATGSPTLDFSKTKESETETKKGPEDLNSKISELEKLLNEKDKNWQSKFDSLNTTKTKLEKDIEEMKTKSMTQEEKLKFEIEQKQKEVERREFEIKSKELEINKRDLLKEKDLLDFSFLNLGNNSEELSKNADVLKNTINVFLEKKITEKMKTGNFKPDSSDNKSTFSLEEIKNMTSDQVSQNLEKIKESIYKK